MSRAEMGALGWDSCDIVIVTGDAYVDLPSFGMAVVGRVLEGQGFVWALCRNPIGVAQTHLNHWANPTSSLESLLAIWIP